MYVFITKQLVGCQLCFSSLSRLPFQGRANRHLFIASIRVGSITHYACKPQIQESYFEQSSHNSMSTDYVQNFPYTSNASVQETKYVSLPTCLSYQMQSLYELYASSHTTRVRKLRLTRLTELSN
jgi:hypothetical protein